MGLDMYLRAKKFIWGSEEEDAAKARQIAEILGFDLEVTEVTFRGMYWRKANAIHGWFVKNVQDGEDDCKAYDVDIEDLEALRDLCDKALKKKDSTLLPPTGGFFFGSEVPDEYYWQDLTETRDGITELMKIPRLYFEYQSSW